jgi:hypothetical protein
MIPSETVSAIAWRSKFWTRIGVASIPDPSEPLMSYMMAWRRIFRGAGGELTMSAAQRLMSLSSWDAAFYAGEMNGVTEKTSNAYPD